MASVYETSSSDEDPQPASKKAKQVYDQKFRSEWLLQKEFKDWLVAPSKNNKDAMCSLCNKTVVSHRSSLLKHSHTQTHKQNES